MRYLKWAGILRLHRNIKEKFAIVDGKKDLGKIDLILDKPRLTLYGSKEKYDTIYKKAACIMEGFCREHPFTDGNKRTALLSVYSFLQANGYYLVIPLNTVGF